MKRCVILALALLLTGCGVPQAYETVSDEYIQPAMEQAQQLHLWLPEEAAAPVAETGGETLYLCDGFTVTVHTMPAGDLDRSLRNLTGFREENLKIVQTRCGDYEQTECVWSAAGEGEDQVGRLLLIDDGVYHYALTAMAPASMVKQVQEQWDALFNGFYVGEAEVNTGS